MIRCTIRVLLALVFILSCLPAATHAQSGVRYFPETGHNVQGRFLQYWTDHGGLAQQGYPLTEEFQEPSALDNSVHTVQYFERAVFEYHPENAGTPYEVLLTQLGTYELTARYPGAVPAGLPNPTNPQAFTETGHSLGGVFRTYWEQHGGLAQEGYPLTDEFVEANPLDGHTYTVQYFERAVFELHPENTGTPYAILLGQLGKYQLTRRYPNGNPAPNGGVPPTARPAPPGLPTTTPLPTTRPAPTVRPPTPIPPAPTSPPSGGRRCGAICNDGTTSSATGSGACSHHGGVREWVYCADSVTAPPLDPLCAVLGTTRTSFTPR